VATCKDCGAVYIPSKGKKCPNAEVHSKLKKFKEQATKLADRQQFKTLSIKKVIEKIERAIERLSNGK
jgi:hypothetical protein